LLFFTIGCLALICSFFGVAYMALVPIPLTYVLAATALEFAVYLASHNENTVFGFLTVFFQIAEPHYFTRPWCTAME